MKMLRVLIQAETDDFSTTIDQHIELAVQVRIKGTPVLGVGGIDVPAPNLAALVPGHLVGISEHSSQATGIGIEIQLQFAVAAGGIGPSENLAVGLLVLVESRTLACWLPQQRLRVAFLPDPDN